MNIERRPDGTPVGITVGTPPTFAFIGMAAAHFQGGSIVLAGMGCPSCGKGFWIESDPARSPEPGAKLICPFCGLVHRVPQ